MGLKDYAQGKTIGCLYQPGIAVYDDQYVRLFLDNFNAMTTNEIYWDDMTEDPYDPTLALNYSDLDRALQFGIDNHLKIKVHPLIWRGSTPEYVKAASLKEIKRMIKDHITRVIDHIETDFPNKVYAIDVVNEGFDQDGSIFPLFPYSSYEYVTNGELYRDCFRWARETGTKMNLLYNDFSAEWMGIKGYDGYSGKADAIFGFCKGLYDEGVLDGVGFQAHIASDYHPITIMTYNFRRFQLSNMLVNISELDVDPLGNEENQASAYSDVAKAIYAADGDLTMWGFMDEYSWLRPREVCIMDKDRGFKPCYHTLESVLIRQAGVNDP